MHDCHTNEKEPESCHGGHGGHAGHGGKKRMDYLLWGSAIAVVAGYALYFVPGVTEDIAPLHHFAHGIHEFVNTIWWGVAVGLVMVGVLSKIPREFVIAVLGRGGTARGVVRAAIGGVLLDLCSHGILMVASKLYERGASTGQVMAFLIASPWNSFSLTLILIALIGLPFTLAFIVLSMAIAIVTGLVFETLTGKGTLPANPNKIDLPDDFRFFAEAKAGLKRTEFSAALFGEMARNGLSESRMVMRWILFGVVLAAGVRALVPADAFGTYFGPTVLGLGLTILVATVLEVCSEGSAPIAADIMTRAAAPGNSFTFLMAGVATDYTEIMILKETTGSWKVALFLPLITLPQVLLIGWLMNMVAAG